MIITYKFRIKDASAKRHLARYARSVNFVWNYCCEIQRHSQRWDRRWPTFFDLSILCGGASQELGILAETIGPVCKDFAKARDAARKCPRWRSRRRSLGWVPFKARAVGIEGNRITYRKRSFHFWKSRDLIGKIKTGAFVQDARGRWYVTFQCEVAADLPVGNGRIGIDLGLKSLATLSDGTTIPALQHYRKYEQQLATAQRARNKGRVKAIHAKIANARRHHLHEQSTRIARENSFIAVGNVNAAQLKRTKMAKSVSDAGWSMFRSMLRYKARRHGATYIEADERLTSQTCSECGSIGGPKGIAGLGIRRWDCSDCGASHDRDVNAAQNILRVGLKCQPLAEGIAA